MISLGVRFVRTPFLFLMSQPPQPPPAKKAAKKTTRKTAKKAAKKVAKKAAAKKGAKQLPPVPTDEASLLGLLGQSQSTLAEKLVSRHKTPLAFKRMSEVRKNYLDFHNIVLEELFANRGLVHQTMGEIIGPEGIGKTTLALYLIGIAARALCPCYYISTEQKPQDNLRALRSISSDRQRAEQLSRLITFSELHQITETLDHIEVWADTMRREMRYPMDIPLVVVIDTWSKLLSDAEAAGWYELPKFLDEKAKKKLKQVGEASNMGHSKHGHSWARYMPSWLRKWNMILILVEHQNDDVVMESGPMARRAATPMTNKTRIGGRAFDQNAAWQLILGKKGQWKDSSSDTILGQEVAARMEKNSYGPYGRRTFWHIRNENLKDTPTFLDPALHFHVNFAKWVSDKKLFELEIRQGRCYSEKLGLHGADYREVWDAFHARPELVEKMGRDLKIRGYDDTIDRILEEQQAAVKSPEELEEEYRLEDEDLVTRAAVEAEEAAKEAEKEGEDDDKGGDEEE